MNQEITIQPTQPLANPGWDNVRLWMDRAAKFQRGSLACQVMAGFELMALHEQHGIRNGRPASGSKKLFHNGKVSWNTLIENELRIPTTTAYRWMKMAQAIKSKYAQLDTPDRLRALLETSPREWTNDDATLISEFVHELSDGRTQAKFMARLGLMKKALPRTEKSPANLMDAFARLARRHTHGNSVFAWEWVSGALMIYGARFTAEPDATVRAQIELLEKFLAVRREWLAQPADQRGPEFRESLAAQLPTPRRKNK